MIFQLGNHDSLRVSFKFIQEYVNVFFTLISTLPGIMVLYYGEEIGMTLGVVRPHQRGSFFNEFHRTPMQWDKSLSGGELILQNDNLSLLRINALIIKTSIELLSQPVVQDS